MDPIIEKLTEMAVSQKEILVRLDSYQKTLDKHTELLDKHNETLLRNTITVEEHHKRSLMLEEAQEQLRTDFKEVEDHVSEVKALGKIVRWAAVVAPIVTAIGAIITMLIKRLG